MPTEKKKKWRRIIESAIQRTTHNAHIICDRTDIHVWHFFVFFIGRSVNTFGDSSLTSTSHFFLFIYLFSGISVPQSSSTFTVVSTQPMTSKNIKINRNVDANFTIAFASSGLFRPNFTLAIHNAILRGPMTFAMSLKQIFEYFFFYLNWHRSPVNVVDDI